MCPSVQKSHVIPVQTLAIELAKRGHDVSFVSIFPINKSVKNYREINLEVNDEYQQLMDEVAKAHTENLVSLKNYKNMNKLYLGFANESIQSAPVQSLMKNEKFDLVVVGYFMSEYLLGFADHFKCPSVIVSPGTHVSTTHKIVGNPLSPEGTYTLMSFAKGTGFMSRVQNFLSYGLELLIFRVMMYNSGKSIYE
jgi:UDP:flavonoid glycosyltransferase YjiC (YdhE family)